jgi:hypothetical protein
MPENIMFMNCAAESDNQMITGIAHAGNVLWTLLKDVLCMFPHKIQVVQDNRVDDEWTR